MNTKQQRWNLVSDQDFEHDSSPLGIWLIVALIFAVAIAAGYAAFAK